uniref:CzcA family heavy metal efflux protein n=1 Tax=uncultured Bacteroidota bacterium TaxID=152509 RepID=H5SHL1_9BACT|nr:CzcA family heavy metal efflux protein [uncultured Bacteroidetes bacterium]
MISAIIRLALRWRGAVLAVTAVLAAIGAWNLAHLPIDAVPDITNNQVQVITISPALGAPDVERLITFPIEQACSNIPGLIELRSFSRFGLSVITLVFDDDIDTYWARQQISERLATVRLQLPPGTGIPELAPVTTGLGEIYQYVVRPKPGYESRYTLADLRTIQDWIVRRQLLGTPGVADVASFGGLLKQYEVVIEPDRLASLGVTISDVASAIERNSSNAGGAYIERGPTVSFIRTEGFLGSITDIENIPVTNAQGFPVLVKDVATVRIGSAIRYGAMCYNDRGEVAGAVVMMLKGENSAAVIKRVKERIAQIERTLPEGITIEPFLDRTKMINSTVATVRTNLLEGAAIVIVVLALLIGNLRAALLVASVIPLSFLIAASLMRTVGVSGNLMSLGAIDFGLLVDGAVIIVEGVLHQLGVLMRQSRSTPLAIVEVVEQTASRLMRAAIFGQLIILIVYVPVLTLQGIEGKMFRPMAEVLLYALGGAFLLSLTYVPAAASYVLSGITIKERSIANRLVAHLERFYRPVLHWALRRPNATLGTALVLFGLSAVAATQLGGEFIPKLEEGDFAVDTRLLTGSSLQETIAATQQCSRILLDSFPEVEKVVTKIGSSEIPTDPMPIEASDMMVILKPKSQWERARSFDELAERMYAALSQSVPGVTFGFQFPVQMRFNELMTGARQDIVCKIFGDDLDTLAYYAERLASIASTIPGARDIYRERMLGMPQIVIRYDRTMLARYGITIEDANRAISAAFAGASVATFYEGERRFDVVVRYDSTVRNNPERLRTLPLRTASGTLVPLEEVADIRSEFGPNQIQREAARRRIIVGFNVRGRDIASTVEELQQRVERELRLPPGYAITYGGTFENLQHARARLAVSVPLALASILVLLYAAFGSLRYGLLIFSAVPLAAIGGVAALLARGLHFSVSAAVGFIALFGIAVLNGVVLTSEANRLRQNRSLLRAVLEATHVRFRPVILTAAVASLGFLPMAISTSPGAEVQRPLATVVIGGLISATLLTLVVLPVLYIAIERRRERKERAGLSPVSVVLLLLPLTAVAANAQQPISLSEAYHLMEQQHPDRLRWYYDVLSAEERRKGWLQLSPLQLELEYGKFNSFTNDSRVSAALPIELPPVHVARKAQRESQYAQAVWGSQWNQMQRRAEVARLFYEVAYWRRIVALLERNDSLATLADSIAHMQLERGAATAAHRATAQLYRSSVSAELAAARVQYQTAVALFNRALGEPSTRYIPNDSLFDRPPTLLVVLDSSRHPLVQQAAAQVDQARSQRALTEASMLPSFVLGYNSMTLIGYHNVDGIDRYYGPQTRFGSLRVGLNVPLPTPWAMAELRATDWSITSAEWEQRAVSWELERMRLEARARRTAAAVAVSTYERQALSAAATLERIATTELANGTLDAYQWALALDRVLAVERAWLDTRRRLNEAIIDSELLGDVQ